MLHGTNNLAEEKQLLKEIYGSRQKTISSCFPLKELDDAIWWFHSNEWRALAYWPFKETTADHKEKIKREKNELVCLKEKAIANAAVKGKLWNSLGSKQVIQDQVNVIGTELNGIKKKVLQVRANAKHVERELKQVEKDTELVKKHLRVTRQRKDIEVSKWLGQLRELRAEGSDYYKYQSLVENARKLAQKKGVAALEEL
ncbi:hypothetical protein I3843_03G163100 [Carya illinoinensis]|nr:hypothetical protein I3843_03G163100 [Carya illinoinensis]